LLSVPAPTSSGYPGPEGPGLRRPNARSLTASLNLDVRTSHRVTGIDKFAQKVTIQAGDDTYALP